MMLLPGQLHAQGYELRVALHDTSGQGIVGVAIVIATESGQELIRRTTDSEGVARFTGLPSVVRVAVEGQVHGGPPLFQLGDDAKGVRFALDLAAAPATLELRAERDGLVLPDPATMLNLEEGGPLAETIEPFPTAALATPAPLQTNAAEGVAGSAVVVGPEEKAERPAAPWAPLLSVLILAVAAGVMIAIQRRRSS